MADKAFLVDTTKCTGCKACQVACKQWNNLPAEKSNSISWDEYTYPEKLSAITFNHVIISDMKGTDHSRPELQMMHKKCYHCVTPNCKAVCPTQAISNENYWVVIDREKCIGCGECANACVYNVPHIADRDYNEYGTGKFINKDKAYKCHACIENPRDIPACASACPSGALTFDYRLKIIPAAKKRLKEIKKIFANASIYGLEEFGGMHVITILKDIPENFGLPKNPKPVKAKKAESRRELFQNISKFAFNLPPLKRALFKLSKLITS